MSKYVPQIAVRTRRKRPYKHTATTSVAPTKLAYTLDQLRARHPITNLARMLGCGADTIGKIRDGLPVRNTALARIQAKIDQLLNPLMDPVVVDRVLTVGTLSCLVDEAKNPVARALLAAALRTLVDDGGIPADVAASAERTIAAAMGRRRA